MDFKSITPAYPQAIEKALLAMDCMLIKEYGIILCTCSTGLPLDSLQNHLRKKHNLLCKDTAVHIKQLMTYFKNHPKQPCIQNAEDAKKTLPKISGSLPLPGIPVHQDGVLCAFEGCGYIVATGNSPDRGTERMKRHWKDFHNGYGYMPFKSNASYQRIFTMLRTYVYVQCVKAPTSPTKEELFKTQFGAPSSLALNSHDGVVQRKVHPHGKEVLQKLGFYGILEDHDKEYLRELITLPTEGTFYYPLRQAVQDILKVDPSYNGLLEIREAICKWRNR